LPSKVEAFKCDYCGKLLKLPHTAAVHEASCKNNPAKRHCITCIHGISACCATVPDWTDPDGPGTEVYGPYCGYHDKPISEKPYFIECDNGGGFDTGLGWYPEFPLPYTCFHYESKGKAEWTPEDQYDGGTKDE
jgi:hypothetical protein